MKVTADCVIRRLDEDEVPAHRRWYIYSGSIFFTLKGIRIIQLIVRYFLIGIGDCIVSVLHPLRLCHRHPGTQKHAARTQHHSQRDRRQNLLLFLSPHDHNAIPLFLFRHFLLPVCQTPAYSERALFISS
ncbi:MAG: hypothetical protein PUE93_01925 [Acidaminococcus sp.]|nr:hypothetical protein [Acidaminococcus sp.]